MKAGLLTVEEARAQFATRTAAMRRGCARYRYLMKTRKLPKWQHPEWNLWTLGDRVVFIMKLRVRDA